VRNADAGLEPRGREAQRCGAAVRPPWLRMGGRIARAVGSTPFRPGVAVGKPGKISEETFCSPRMAGESLVAPAGNLWANESIRQKIIGHRMAVGWSGCFGSGRLRRGFGVGGSHGALALLDKPAGDHGVGVFVEPLVKEGSDLLAEIGGVAEARKLVTLQSIAGSGEKEFPGRLGAAGIHRFLQYLLSNVCAGYCTTRNSMITSHRGVPGLWKFVENEENPQGACSGCAGDYEDPDRSAWEEDFEEEEPKFVEEVGNEPGIDA